MFYGKAPFAALLPLLIILNVFTVTAQTTSTQIRSTATVNTPLTGGTSSPLSFGVVPLGEETEVDARGSSAGAFYFSGDSEDDITVTLPQTVSLKTFSGSGGSMTVTLTLNNVLVNDRDEQGSSRTVNFDAGSATVVLGDDRESDGVEDGLGRLYLWIGGRIDPAPTQQRGSYEGTFTARAVYTN